MNSLILIIDTAHPTARVVLVSEKKVLGVREWENTPKVGTDVLENIEGLLLECGKALQDITRVAVHSGPWSFGLLRTGIGTAATLAQTLHAELVETCGDTVEEMVDAAQNATPVASIEPKYT